MAMRVQWLSLPLLVAAAAQYQQQEQQATTVFPAGASGIDYGRATFADDRPRVSVASAAAERAALLGFRRGGDPDGILASWDTNLAKLIGPCAAESWNARDEGWRGVMCDGTYGRVTYLGLPHGRLRGDVAELAALTALLHLSLGGNKLVHGDIAQLTTLVQLRSLNLAHTSVHGNVALLSQLPHLGEGWQGPDGNGGRGGLWLADTLVSGEVAAVRSLSGFHDWGRSSIKHFSSCVDFGAARRCAAHPGLAAVVDPSAVAGQDECACCVVALPDHVPLRCIAWHPTASCDPADQSVSAADEAVPCTEEILGHAYGFCECGGQVSRPAGGCVPQPNRPFNCEDVCLGIYAEGSHGVAVPALRRNPKTGRCDVSTAEGAEIPFRTGKHEGDLR